MKRTYDLNRTCSRCGKPIFDKSKTGLCGECYKHFGKYGSNNPFFGKHHSKETIEDLKAKCSESSKKMWENSEYRKKVIEGATGLKRSEEFKETQRKNALKQFKDINQREIRSEKMKETWKSGRIVYTEHPSINRSKIEKEFISKLEEKIPNGLITESSIKYIDNNSNRWLFPDIIYKNYIIEFNGDYWHANPKKFKADDLIDKKGITAQEQWEEDKRKKEIYESLGYKVIYVWESDFKENKEEILNKIFEKIKE